MSDFAQLLARYRVRLGFLVSDCRDSGWRARRRAASPSGRQSRCVGEALRIWAAGHLEKGREVTASGPYRLTRHPLYLGSSIIASGVRDCIGQRCGDGPRGRVPGADLRRGDQKRGSAPHRKVRERLSGVSRRPREAKRFDASASIAPFATANTAPSPDCWRCLRCSRGRFYNSEFGERRARVTERLGPWACPPKREAGKSKPSAKAGRLAQW